jgi:hypothetical protein
VLLVAAGASAPDRSAHHGGGDRAGVLLAVAVVAAAGQSRLDRRTRDLPCTCEREVPIPPITVATWRVAESPRCGCSAITGTAAGGCSRRLCRPAGRPAVGEPARLGTRCDPPPARGSRAGTRVGTGTARGWVAGLGSLPTSGVAWTAVPGAGARRSRRDRRCWVPARLSGGPAPHHGPGRSSDAFRTRGCPRPRNRRDASQPKIEHAWGLRRRGGQPVAAVRHGMRFRMGPVEGGARDGT